LAPLRAFLFDRDKNVWARSRAAESLGKMGQRHPETRSEVVSALVARLDPDQSQVPEDEILNGIVITELLDLKAVEVAPVIRQACQPTPYSEFVIPQRITCPKCGAVDRYELSGMAYITLTAELLKKLVAHELGGPGAEPERGFLRFIRFGLADGREMHPYEAR